MSPRRQIAAAAALASLLWTPLLQGCGRSARPGPVRTAEAASALAQRTLQAAGLDEEVVVAQREGGAWIVVTRWRESSVAGHLVTIDAATGGVRVERYRSVELGGPQASPES